jgi:zona occludens toxin (predicted ATPase)
MIWYITGRPRSGKSYYAVHKLLSVVKSKRYKTIYTNIGGFKFGKFDNVKKLDFEDFFDVYIPALYKDFKKAKKELEDYDQWLIDKITKDGYYKCAFFVDEVQEYLPNDRVHLRWLFSYQGHLGFDFYLMTQNLGLVHTKYKYTIESVINSVSSTNKVFSSMLSSPLLEKVFKNSKLFKKIQDSFNYGVYQVYSSTKMSRSDKMNTFRVQFKQEVFDLYKSGDKVSQKSPLFGRLLLIIALLIGIYI